MKPIPSYQASPSVADLSCSPFMETELRHCFLALSGPFQAPALRRVWFRVPPQLDWKLPLEVPTGLDDSALSKRAFKAPASGLLLSLHKHFTAARLDPGHGQALASHLNQLLLPLHPGAKVFGSHEHQP